MFLVIDKSLLNGFSRVFEGFGVGFFVVVVDRKLVEEKYQHFLDTRKLWDCVVVVDR